jgi:DNA polymerase I-like protein with 3'-5' exonuclease and polymerase domains
MPLVHTHELRPGELRADNLQVYNGLDSCVTLEVHEELQTLFNVEPEIYTFERALQAPALEMMLRGWAIDEYERGKAIAALRSDLALLDETLDDFGAAVWDRREKDPHAGYVRPLNPRSTHQLKAFFYGTMHLPEQWASKKGVKKLSMDREALEKLEVYFHARPIIATILEIRELTKQISVLETEVEPDGRMHTSYNIAGTETGRWSSSRNVFGTGTNLQNLQTDENISTGALSIRRMFVADPGHKIVGIDLEQAESREVGWLCGTLFQDWSYLDACEAGDLHTTTSKLIWPNLDWTGDPRADRALAEQPFYRNYSYRYMAKRGGHGSTYLGTPWTMSRHLKVPVKLMEDFQERFFVDAFPCIPRWQRWTAERLQLDQQLTTPFGRTRHFFGRPREDTTLREAVAYSPQSSTGDRLNLALWRVWKHMGTRVQILAQVHDALYFQFPEAMPEHELVREALALVSTPMRDPRSGRLFDVPGEAKSGWNWGSYDAKFNPDGLKKIKLGVPDDRVRRTQLTRVL